MVPGADCFLMGMVFLVDSFCGVVLDCFFVFWGGMWRFCFRYLVLAELCF